MQAQSYFTNIYNEIDNGNFDKAKLLIQKELQSENISDTEKLQLKFEIERMNRISKDFKKTKKDIIDYVVKFKKDVNDEDILRWENSGALEYKIINGEKFYFNRAQANLFRIDKNAKKIKEEITGIKKDGLDLLLERIIPERVNEIEDSGSTLGNPQKIKLNYTLTVDANAVPEGEIIRCWLPYPREGHERQKEIELLSVNDNDYFIAPNDRMQRTIYLEKYAEKDKPTIFNYELSFTAFPQQYNIDPAKIKNYDKTDDEYLQFTSEREPHIVFTDKIKEASKQIVGDEKNPYLIAKKIFTWISNNIPWAGAREYSTIRNISDYCITNMHGDCGIKTILFMTLCRFNGIPVKWQSGWMLHPGEVNLHDWAEAYFEGYGWVPVDQSFGLIDSQNEKVKYFFLGGIDEYHFIVNDDYSQPLYPAKIYPRSETVDFQRGEVEWRGGNLYFDKWDYKMDVEYIDR